MSNLRRLTDYRGGSATQTSRLVNGHNFSGPGMILGTGATSPTSAQGRTPTTPQSESPKPTSSQNPAAINVSSTTPIPGELTERDVKFAFICREIFEYDAMLDALDFVGTHFPWDGRYGSVPYRWGYINGHLVVVTALSEQGRADVAIVATNLKDNFPGIHLIVLVGTCSAAPYNPTTRNQDPIMLGDVIFSTQVQHYLKGAHLGNHLNTINTIPQDTCDQKILRLMRMAQSRIDRRELKQLTEKEFETLRLKDNSYKYPDPHTCRDILYRPYYPHVHRDFTCSEPNRDKKCNLTLSAACSAARKASCRELNCDRSHAKRVRQNDNTEFSIHWGIFASGEVEMGNAVLRDCIASSDQMCAFETEASGMWRGGPALIIKGASDYADNHNGDGWKTYAAGRAACSAKALVLQCWPNSLRTS